MDLLSLADHQTQSHVVLADSSVPADFLPRVGFDDRGNQVDERVEVMRVAGSAECGSFHSRAHREAETGLIGRDLKLASIGESAQRRRRRLRIGIEQFSREGVAGLARLTAHRHHQVRDGVSRRHQLALLSHATGHVEHIALDAVTQMQRVQYQLESTL